MPGQQSLNVGVDGRVEITCSQNSQKQVHPLHCPADVPVGYVCRVAVPGKKLVLASDDRFLPEVSVDDVSGNVGRILPLRYHPDCSSSHPALQVAFRCNLDVQCMDRIFVLKGIRKVLRHKRVVVRRGSNGHVEDDRGGDAAKSESTASGKRRSTAIYCARCKRVIEGTPIREHNGTDAAFGPLHFGCLLVDRSWEYFDWQQRQHLVTPATSNHQVDEAPSCDGVPGASSAKEETGLLQTHDSSLQPDPTEEFLSTDSALAFPLMRLDGGGLDDDEASLEDEADYDQDYFDVVAKEQSEEQLAQEMYESMCHRHQPGVSSSDGNPQASPVEDDRPAPRDQIRPASVTSQRSDAQEEEFNEMKLPIRSNFEDMIASGQR